MPEEIKKILEAGNMAPSGENCQPWRFVVKGTITELYSLPERNQSIYGWGQRDAYIANGAVLENISIAATHYGYRASIKLFPEDQNQSHIATIIFERAETPKDNLYDVIAKRSTNRKQYKKIPLTTDQISIITNAANEVGYGKILLNQDPFQKKELASVGSTNEVVMLDNESIHGFFFNHINWNKKEDDEKKIGFYIETLELPPPAKMMFSVIKNWSVAKILNKVGFNKLVGKQNAAINDSSSAIGIIVAEGSTPIDYVKTGRVMQRMWLRITELNLSLQPLTGVLFFMLNIKAGETQHFSAKQVNIIREAHSKIETIFDVKDKTIPFMFRVGDGGQPTARASRFSIDQAIEIQ